MINKQLIAPNLHLSNFEIGPLFLLNLNKF